MNINTHRLLCQLMPWKLKRKEKKKKKKHHTYGSKSKKKKKKEKRTNNNTHTHTQKQFGTKVPTQTFDRYLTTPVRVLWSVWCMRQCEAKFVHVHNAEGTLSKSQKSSSGTVRQQS